MRDLAPRARGSVLRRALAIGGRLSIAVGLVLLISGWMSVTSQGRTVAYHVNVSHAPASAGAGSPVTVTGPKMWDPSTGSPQAKASTVTASQAKNLVAQSVTVSWSNFTPSTTYIGRADLQYPWYVDNGGTGTYYAVMVAECIGNAPTSFTDDCPLAETEDGVPQTIAPPGGILPNTTYGITDATGSGQLNLPVLTTLQGGTLTKSYTCGVSGPCSLVVVPVQGGIPAIGSTPADCGDHDEDTTYAEPGRSFSVAPATAGGGGDACSWDNDRITIPLTFSPAAQTCPDKNPAFISGGSPMLALAMSQWQAKLCGGSHSLTFAYVGADTEPTAISALTSGNTGAGSMSVAFTTRSAAADNVPTTGEHFIYAPVAITSQAIAYWFDNSLTGQPEYGMKLDQRLMAKLLTTSYDPDVDCKLAAAATCDKGVGPRESDYQNYSLFYDPEFYTLNPSMGCNFASFLKGTGGCSDQSSFNLQPYVTPTVLGGNTDMSWTLTSWIAANTAAADFMANKPDPSDPSYVNINKTYVQDGVTYPVNEIVNDDGSAGPIWQEEFHQPGTLTGLGTQSVQYYEANNADAGTANNTQTISGQPPIWSADPPEAVGHRALMAVLDNGSALQNSFPVAAIPNAAGKFVTPSNATMAAAVDHMTSQDGTEQVNQSNTDPAAYPLTMPIYAMVPTTGLSHATASAVAQFLRYGAGPGQTPGSQPGDLPPGFLPLPKSWQQETLKYATDVQEQNGARGSGGVPNPGSSSGGSPSVSATPSTGPSVAASTKSAPSLSLPPARAGLSLAAAKSPVLGLLRFALPALLILGGLAALGGSSVLLSSGEGGLAGAVQRGWHRVATARQSARQATGNGTRPAAQHAARRLPSLGSFRPGQLIRRRKP